MSKYVSWPLDELEDLLSHVEGTEPGIFAPALRAHMLPVDEDWRTLARLRGGQTLAALMASIDERLAAAERVETSASISRPYIPMIYSTGTRSVRRGAVILAVSRQAAEARAQGQLAGEDRLLGFA